MRAYAAGLLAVVLLLAPALSGCRAGGEPQPPEIAYGRDVCDACGMLISEPRQAAATLTAAGTTRRFDDIGEMFAFHAQHADEQVRAWFVHDHDTRNWLRGERALYVKSAQLHTPMGGNVAAFAERAAAEAFAAQNQGEVLTFEQARAGAGTPMPMRMPGPQG